MSENNNEYIKKIGELCLKMKDLCPPKSNDDNEEELFNIILATSDRYYRENYHSDIIKCILEQKNEYTKIFIDYLNANLPTGKKKINIDNYSSPKITREDNGIDILIKGKEHCIIIENKINNAGDTTRQLPKYYDSLVAHQYEVDIIVYLSLDGKKYPDKSTWTEQDHKLGLDNILITCAASNKYVNDLIKGFLGKCLVEAKTVQENSFFCQYIDLLRYLGRKQMDYELMEAFYKKIAEDSGDYKTLLDIKSMIEKLKRYRNERRFKIFQNDREPFCTMGIWNENFNFKKISYIKNADIALEVRCNDYFNTKLIFSDDPNIQYDLINIVLETLGLLQDFKCCEKNCYVKEFSFPEDEDPLNSYLKNFLSLLENKKDKIKEEIEKQIPT